MWLQRKIMARVHKDPNFFDLDAEWCVPFIHIRSINQFTNASPASPQIYI
jgi:hypothetical protein